MTVSWKLCGKIFQPVCELKIIAVICSSKNNFRKTLTWLQEHNWNRCLRDPALGQLWLCYKAIIRTINYWLFYLQVYRHNIRATHLIIISISLLYNVHILKKCIQLTFNCPSQETEVTSTPTRPVDNVVITTKGLQDRNINILGETTVENKGKLILTEIFPSVQKHYIF